jgi:diadenylate cyclase
MAPLQSLYADVIFRLSSLSWLGVLDLLLVTVAFYLLLSLVRRSRAALLLRGALVLGVVLFVVTILLPLPTFDWLVRGMLLAMLVATPIIFQPELRRLLERLGRSAGLTWTVRRTGAETVVPRLVRAVERLSSSHTGALIALEGEILLHDVVETGVPIGGEVTSELLQAIFYPDNPLHDGAVVLREDQLVAASCVLPLTQRPLYFGRRLGTRHRAAVGLSETSDALVIVVSEETGTISVAYAGQLQRSLDGATLRKQLFDFYLPDSPTAPPLSLRSLISQTRQQFWQRRPSPAPRQLWSSLGLLFASLTLALVAWSFVVEQTSPARRARVPDIPLRVENVPPGDKLVTQPPASVSAIIQTTDSVLETLSTNSFQAIVSLEGLSPGLHHLPVQVNSGASGVRVLSVEPAALDLELAPIISRTLEVTIELSDREKMSPAYELVGNPVASPDQVQILGPAPLVKQVNQVQATISLANVSTSLREMRPLRAMDEAGREVTGVSLQPTQVQVRVSILRRLDARDVGVRVVTSGTPPPGYWLSGLSVTPASVTLRGNSNWLAEVRDFVDTLPVDVSQAAGDLSVQIPLDLPPGAQALDSDGNPVKTVTVSVRIAARRGDLVVTRPVELVEPRPGVTLSVNPSKVDLLLSGPLPILNQIEADPNLVRVLVTLPPTGLAPGQSADLTPTVVAPDGIRAQSVPPSVLVTLP